MTRTARLALTGGLTLAAALTIGGAAFAGPNPAPEPDAQNGSAQYVTVQQDPAPHRDCPGRGAQPAPAPSTPAAEL